MIVIKLNSLPSASNVLDLLIGEFDERFESSGVLPLLNILPDIITFSKWMDMTQEWQETVMDALIPYQELLPS